MSGEVAEEHGDERFTVDPTVPQPARIYNYLLGGREHFEADRRAAEYIYAALPGGIETARGLMRASAAFMRRVVCHLTAEVGLRQFLNIGTVIPMFDSNLHEVAQRTAPDARVVYVVRDATVLAHAHRLLENAPDGTTGFIHSDLRDPPGLVQRAAATLDLSRPVGVMLLGTLSYIADERDPWRIVSQLMEPLAPGSHLAVSHIASDLEVEEMAEAARRQQEVGRSMPLPFVARSRAAVSRFFEGLELVGPGVTELDLWEPDPEPDQIDGVDGLRSRPPMIPAYGGLARKP